MLSSNQSLPIAEDLLLNVVWIVSDKLVVASIKDE